MALILKPTDMQKKFHIITLGCKVNQYESQALREAWLLAGHSELPSAAGADLVLVNSCAITAKAVTDLRAVCRRVRKAAPGCELLVTGCAAQALPGELEELPVDALVPQKDKLTLLRWLGKTDAVTGDGNGGHADGGLDPALDFALLQAAHSGPDAHEDNGAGGIEDFWAGAGPEEVAASEGSGFPAFSINDYARSRAVLKIHDGCSQHCTYCIVPQGRGPSVSRPWPETLAEAGRLIRAGFREIVLNGVNLRQYGLDFARPEDFWDLIIRMESVFAPQWSGKGLRFRISSLEPGQLNQKALDVLGKSRLIAPHLHLSLQSGSPRTLKRMGRGHYDPAAMPDFLRQLKQIWPAFGLGADFITGFPGESDGHFEETMALAHTLPLTYAHVFPYSKRPGTAAARLPEQLAPEVKKERAARLRGLVDAKKEAFLLRQLQMPVVYVAPEESAAQTAPVKGVDEFYSDCVFNGAVEGAGKTLIAAKPVGVRKHTLLVEKI